MTIFPFKEKLLLIYKLGVYIPSFLLQFQQIIKDEPQFKDDYYKDKPNLKTMLIDDIINEMKEMLQGKEIEVNL